MNKKINLLLPLKEGRIPCSGGISHSTQLHYTDGT